MSCCSNLSEPCRSNASWHSSYSGGGSGGGRHMTSSPTCRCCHRISDSALHAHHDSLCHCSSAFDGGQRCGPVYPKAAFQDTTTDRSSRGTALGRINETLTSRLRSSGGGGRSQSSDRHHQSAAAATTRRDRSQSRDAAMRGRTASSQDQGHCCSCAHESEAVTTNKQTTRSCSSSG